MRWIDILRISIRMVFANRLRTALTVLGIGTATGLVIVLTGLGYGVQEITIGSIVQSKSLLSIDVFPGPDNSIPLTNKTLAAVKHFPNVSEISPVMTTEGQVKFGPQRISNTVLAVEPSYLSTEGISLEGGASFSGSPYEIILSPQTLSLLETDADTIIGKEIQFSFVNPNSENELLTVIKPMKVIGITNGTESTSMFVPYSLLQDFPTAGMNSIKILARDRDSVVFIRDTLKGEGYTVETLLETLDSARRVFRWVTIGLVVIALIALVVASIGMFNTLTIALLERTREIGIMKAIGVTNSSIKRLFLAESMIFGLLGGLAGLGVGLLIDRSINIIINRLATYYGGQSVSLFRYPPFFLAAMILFPMILGVITGLYPAIRASRFNPLRALKYE